MKKQLGLFAFIVLVGVSCRDNTVYKAYQEFNQTWYLQEAMGLPVTQKEIRLIDFSQCKKTKKRAQSEGGGCTAPINKTEKGGLSLSYSLRVDNVMEIRKTFVVPENLGDGVTVYVPTQLEKDLNSELIGVWNYTIENNTLTLKNGAKSIVFNL